MSRVLVAVRNLNVPRHLCAHALGENHTIPHRMCVGLVIMVCGVMIAKAAHVFEYYALQVVVDTLGYSVHGLGLTPFLEHLLVKFKE